MAVTHGPHIAYSKAESGHFIDGQYMSTQEPRKLSQWRPWENQHLLTDPTAQSRGTFNGLNARAGAELANLPPGADHYLDILISIGETV